MGKKDRDLFTTLRASGLRKKVARGLSDPASRRKQGKAPRGLVEAADRLRSAASALEGRAGHSARSDAAKKAARTRKRDAAKRSAAAKRGAKTRARTR